MRREDRIVRLMVMAYKAGWIDGSLTSSLPHLETQPQNRETLATRVTIVIHCDRIHIMSGWHSFSAK